MALKKLIAVIVLLVLATSCKRSNDEKARDLIENYCDANVKDYQPITFIPAQPYYTPYQKSDLYSIYNNKKQNLNLLRDSLKRVLDHRDSLNSKHRLDTVAAALIAVDHTIAAHAATYKGTRQGWMVSHTYTQKNPQGFVVTVTTVFIIDDDFNNILFSYDK